jgi:hypothetical protein
MPNYTIEEINIGDEIYYEDKYRSNKYPRWKVIQKLDRSMLLISPNESGTTETRLIDIFEVRKLVLFPKA